MTTTTEKPKKKQISWTPKQREIAELVEQGKEFAEIIAQGYSKHMTSRVMAALKEGLNPPVGEGGTTGEGGTAGTRKLISASAPKQAPIMFAVANKQIALDPLELYRAYRYYEDLTKKNEDGDKPYAFSEVLTMGVQLVWCLRQDIPITENFLKALFYGYT
jgi:hypothetical protein